MLSPDFFLAQAQPDGLIYWIDRAARAPLSKVLLFAAIITVVRLALYPYLNNTPKHQRFGFYKVAKVVNEFGDALVYAAIVVFMLLRPFAIQTFHIPTGSMIDTLLVGDFIVADKWTYRTKDPQFQDIVVFKPPQQALFEGQSQTDFIKRLVGEPGDVIEVIDNQLYRNGEPVDEDYVTYTSTRNEGLQLVQDALPEGSTVPIPDFKLVEIPEELRDRFDNPEILDAGVIPLQREADLVNANRRTAEPFMLTEEDGKFLWALPPAEVPEGYYLFIGDNRNGSFDSRSWGVVPRESVIGRSWFIWLPFNRIGSTQ